MTTYFSSLEQGGENSSEAFNALVEESYMKVYNFAYRLSGNRADAEDLTQEACFRAYRSFDEYEGNRPFENWIFRIVSRLFLDMLRARRRRVKVVSLDAPIQLEGEEGAYFQFADQRPNPEEHLLEAVLSEELQDVISSLSDQDRLILLLADVNQLPYGEIAEQLDKPVGTIRSRLHRAHKRVRIGLKLVRRKRLLAQSRPRAPRRWAALIESQAVGGAG